MEQRLIDANKAGAELACYNSPTGIVDEALYEFASDIISEAPTVEAIPITDFYRMISNVKLDCDDDIKFSSEYFDGYGDGTRNAIVEMVQSLCGDCDGDCDEF